MKYVCIMIVPGNCHILFEFSWQSGPCHPFWGLATFPIYSSVLSCWTNRTPSTPPSSVFLHGFQVISIALMAQRICLSTFPLSALILICSLKAFLLPGKADIDVFDYSSFVAYCDTSASSVQMHLHKQQQSNWRIVSKTCALLNSYRWVTSQAGPEYKMYY
jgi:hypothetical protein